MAFDDTGWSNYIECEIDGAIPGIVGPVIMPCAVQIPGSLLSVCKPGLSDLRCVDSSMNELPFGIESSVNGIVHFRGTFSTGKTTVRFYGGNSEADDNQDWSNVPSGTCTGWWPLGDSGPTYAYDRSVNGRNCTQSGGVLFGQSARVSNGCQFDGSDDTLDSGVNASVIIPDGYGTIMLWMKPTGDPFANSNIWNLPTAVGDTNGFFNISRGDIGVGDRIYVYDYTLGGIASTSIPCTPGEWVHIVYHHDTGSPLKLYKNGSLEMEHDPPATGNSWLGSEFHIGSGFFKNFVGSIDNVIAYSTALSDDQIAFAAEAPDSGMISWGSLQDISYGISVALLRSGHYQTTGQY